MQAKDAILGSIGIVEKAMITILDRRGEAVTEEEAVQMKRDNPGLSVDSISDTNSPLNKYVYETKRKHYIVQFNPASLNLQARGPGYMNVMAFDEKGRNTGPSKQRVRIYFTVQLIIDQEDNLDCFLEDKFNVSPTQLGQNIAKGVMKMAGKKKEPTVKDTVEAFIAAIRSSRTRDVAFTWGRMYYHGELNSVNAQYVMFNRKGQPVRANINLAIQCFNEDSLPNSLGEWEGAYKKAFGDEAERGAGVGQTLGNVFNLG